MTKAIVSVAALTAVAVGLVMGPRAVWTTLRGVTHNAQESFERDKPDAQQVAELNVLLKDMDGNIHRFAEKLGEVQMRAQAADKRVQDLERESIRLRETLARAKDLLSECSETMTVAGRRYTRAEVNADALARLARAEQLAKHLESERMLAKQLNDAVQEAKSNLDNAQLVRKEKATQLSSLEARLANARLQEEVQELTKGLVGQPIGPQTELAQKFDAFERRVNGAERRARQSNVNTTDGFIDYEGKSTPPDATEALSRFLNGEQAKK